MKAIYMIYLCYRLTIPLAFSIGFVAGIIPYITSGPLLKYYAVDGTRGCEEYGWYNILYLNIYQDIISPRTPGVSIIEKIDYYVSINFNLVHSNWYK